MLVTRLRVHPVKSLAGYDVGMARVETWGLAGDRRWAVVDRDGATVTARERNRMLGLTAEALADGGVLLGDAGASGSDLLRVDPPTDATPIPVGISRQREALPAGDEADEWLSTRIGQPVRLVWQPDPRVRPVNPTHGGLAGEHVSLADVGPLLLTTQASLAQLDRWTDDETPPLDMLRFRPNVVIDGDEPFAEEAWSHVDIGSMRFRVVGVCDRCVMTTIDPTTLVRGKEPIRTLARHRRRNGKTYFGIWLAPETTGEIAVAEEVVPRLG
ncbi:MOSC domain-containing protein [Agromyces intestinalis]|uniref:MOSC domain-containing protein n=1 Tax=Agromyces intestinalis TaxID=2592652 RepID=A0A5C1YH69_9MICO|nr:MOSC N-terminal beta barrel domain-containing protein [Agromyces intestinalis]QEO14905.1 MOSC domain-containing protein [Agromyces intestinalis]